MDAQLLLHGLVWEVKPNEYISKKNGKEETIYMLEVTVEQVVKDGQYRRKSVEKINYKIDDLEKNQVDMLLTSIDKYIYIAMEFRSWQKNGVTQSAVMPTSNFIVFDKNPLEQKTEQKKSA